jgi:ATP-dependent RNA helicase DDX47/RRP3
MITAANSLNWKYPTPIQIESLPPGLAHKDVCGMAETGSGKTGAFALPILHHVLESRARFFALVLEPTRELVIQVAGVFRSLGQQIGAKVCAITGGVEEKGQIHSLEKQPHVIVATTGRLNQIMREKPQLNFSAIKMLVFDEADQMLSPSFFDEVKVILERIGPNHQSFLFSATMPEEIENLVAMTLSDPVSISLTERHQVAGTLTEYVAVAPTNRKESVLYVLIRQLVAKSCIVFTNSCKTAHIVAKVLQTLKVSAVLYHGKLEQTQRREAVAAFGRGKYSVLVSTNVASRGLDLPDVECVINFDVPEKNEDYIHRVGRAGRATKAGFAVTIVTMNDLPAFAALEKFLRKRMERKDVTDDEIAAVAEDVEAAKKAGNESYKEYSKWKTQKLKAKHHHD